MENNNKTTIVSSDALTKVARYYEGTSSTTRTYIVMTRYTYAKDEGYFKTWTSHSFMTYEDLRTELTLHEANLVSRGGVLEFVKVFITDETYADLLWEKLVEDKTIFYSKKIQKLREQMPTIRSKVLYETPKHKNFRATLAQTYISKNAGGHQSVVNQINFDNHD